MQKTGFPQLSVTASHRPVQFGATGMQRVVVVVLLVVVVDVLVLVDVVVGDRQMPFGRFPGGLLFTHKSPLQQLAVVAHCNPSVLQGEACIVDAPVMMASAVANKVLRI